MSLILETKLSDLNDDGLNLVDLLNRVQIVNNEPAPLVRIDKFSHVKLRSLLTWSDRNTLFDKSGKMRRSELTQAELDKIRRHQYLKGELDSKTYSFNPVRWIYRFGKDCHWCIQLSYSDSLLTHCNRKDHPRRIDKVEPHALKINELGIIFRWFVELAYFEPIMEPDNK